VIFGILDASANSRWTDQSVRAAVNRSFTAFPKRLHVPGDQAIPVSPAWCSSPGRAPRSVFSILPEVQRKLQGIPGSDLSGPPRRCRAADSSRSSSFWVQAETAEILASRSRSTQACRAAVRFPRSSTSRSTSRSPRSSWTATRVAELGLDLQRVGSDMAAMVGAIRNRFDIGAAATKLIPQIQRWTG